MSNLEELERKYEEMINKYEELGKEIERLKKGNVVRWKPVGEFWYIDEEGDAIADYWDGCFADNWRYINHNVFKTEKEALEYRDYILARAEYVKEFSKEEWKKDYIIKHFIWYSHSYKKLNIGSEFTTQDMTKLYFESVQKAEEFISKYKKQILKYEFGVEVE